MDITASSETLVYQQSSPFGSTGENAPKPPTTDAYEAVNEFLDVSHRDLSKITGFLKSASPEEIESFLRMLKKLTEKGIVGYEYLDLKGRPYKSFIVTRLVEPYSRLRTYRGPVSSEG